MPDSRPTRPARHAPPPPHFRRLVRCESCFKQFDAGEMAPGERFRCLCGTVLRVPDSAAQEAPVVRCASCGAPRAAGAVDCTFCEAPFVLGESERNTLCPVCRKLMVRRAFAGSSGVVLDVCGTHGLWFDAEELDGVLAWIRGGGLSRAEERHAEERKEAARREAAAKQEIREVVAEKPADAQWLDLLGSLVDLVLDAVGRRR